MHKPPRILVVDDQLQNVEILQDRLAGHGYEMLTATTGEVALEIATTAQPDLILLDIVMPGMDGIEVCRHLKANVALPFIPVIMITAKAGTEDIVLGLEAGADEYLTKPLEQAALVARVKSMLRLKAFHDRVWQQANQLEVEAEALQHGNGRLAAQLRKQMAELERLGLLKRFVSPTLAEWVLASGDRAPLGSQRREVAIVCCMLHGLSALADRTAPDTVFDMLSAYHESIGPLLTAWDGMVQGRTGDALVVVHAPSAGSAPLLRAIDMASAVRQHVQPLADAWRHRGYPLDVGIGIAHGEATLGLVDLDGQWDYVVLGSVRQLACRLGERATSGRILVSRSVWQAIHKDLSEAPAGHLALTGLPEPIPFFEIPG